MLALVGVVASVLTVLTPGTASAAVPTLKWSAVTANPKYSSVVTSPTGDVTVGCYDSGSQDLTTYNSTGTVVRQISRTTTIDGVQNCITEPIVDKNGTVYGVPYGTLTAGGTGYGPNLLAYSGNTLKWKYPVGCGSDRLGQWAVGADGNIYALTPGHLIGIAPDLKAGQTQPDKVMDVSIPSDCSAHVLPYKDGIMVHGQSNGNGRYYSYGGKYLGQATIGDIWYEKMGADGQLFVGSRVTGSYKSAKISMYDPRKGAVAWETIASTSGANVNDVQVYPMPGGGVAALINEQKMDVTGQPVIPTEYVYTLVILNSNGLKVRSVTLPNTNANGDIYLTPRAYPDVNGKIVVVRDMYIKTDKSWPSQVDGISVAAYDPATNAWPYQQVMSGNALQANGSLYGYRQNYAGSNGPVLGSGAAFVVGYCSGSCPNPGSRLYPIAISGIGMDYPRGDVLSRTARPSASYVALGDSFSSGEGVPPFETGTDIPGVNTCHRSTNAYARLIAGTGSIPSLGTGGFRACSGAVTTNITDLQQWNESIQLDWWPDTTTQVVTMTIGGNDIGFADFATACVTGTCQVGSSAYNTSLDKINNVLPGALTATYQRVLAEFPNAQIYVMDYPQVIADKQSSDPFDSRCPYMYNSTGDTGAAHYPWEDAWAARDIVSKLDAKISTAIGNMNNARLHYVPTNNSGSPFAGHEVCGINSTSWFQNVDQGGNNLAYVFHPNDLGQQGYATVAAATINAG